MLTVESLFAMIDEMHSINNSVVKVAGTIHNPYLNRAVKIQKVQPVLNRAIGKDAKKRMKPSKTPA